MKVGRPSKYNKETLNKVAEYLETFEQQGDPIPSIAGLSVNLGVSRSTINAWKLESDKKEFSDMLDQLLATQERILLGKGLKGEFNSNITKLVLTKHAYSDKSETNIKADVTATEMTPEERTQRLKELDIERQKSQEI